MLTGSLAPTTTSQDWVEVFEVVDNETGEAFDLTGCVIRLAVREGCEGDDYGFAWRGSPVLSASSDDGSGAIELTDEGFVIRFLASRMAQCAPATLKVGVTIERDGETRQFFIGTLPILPGYV